MLNELKSRDTVKPFSRNTIKGIPSYKNFKGIITGGNGIRHSVGDKGKDHLKKKLTRPNHRTDTCSLNEWFQGK